MESNIVEHLSQFQKSRIPKIKPYRGNWYGTDTNFTVYKEDYIRSGPTKLRSMFAKHLLIYIFVKYLFHLAHFKGLKVHFLSA